jgi:hypothetical protein
MYLLWFQFQVLFFITIVVSVGLEWSLFNSVPMRLVLFDDGVTSAENYEGLDLFT